MRKTLRSRFGLILVFGLMSLSLVLSVPANAKSKTEKKAAPKATKQVPKKEAKRRSSISFEDELIEGMNRNPFDSLTSVRTKDMRDTEQLYRVKYRYSSEIIRTAQEAGYQQ